MKLGHLFASLPALWLLLPGEAHACGACVCHGDDYWVVPFASRSVPLNLRLFVWLQGKDPSTLALTTSESAAVPFTLTPAGIADAYWLEPNEPLEPGTDYGLSVLALVNPQATDFGASFTTGTSEDHLPPAVGRLTIADSSERAGMCVASVGSTVVVEGFLDDGMMDSASIIEFEEPSIGSHWFVPISPGVWSAGFGRALDGSNGTYCFGYRAFGGAQAGVSYTVTATVWDIAGNPTIIRDVSFVATRTDAGDCPSWPPDAGSDGSTATSTSPIMHAGGGCALSAGGSAAGSSRGLPLGLLGAAGALSMLRRRRPGRL